MPLETIRLRGFTEPDRAAVENAVIARVQADPEPFLAAYRALPGSFGGRYVCADLFKETFAEFNAAPEARNRYNGPVHNAAAVLSAEAFRRSIADTADPKRNEVIFLTGIPGAGKTSSVLVEGHFAPTWRTLFEGQMSNPATAIPKIERAISEGLKARIFVVHTLPETALDNTFKRFNEYGRGASLSVMSDIQGNLPNGIQEIRDRFQENVTLTVIDRRDINNQNFYYGWDKIHVLASEGHRETIRERLERHLERARADGRISDECYGQAGGRFARDARMASEVRSRTTTDGDRRGLPAGDRKADLVKSADAYWQSVADKASPVPKDNSLSMNESVQPKPKLRP